MKMYTEQEVKQLTIEELSFWLIQSMLEVPVARLDQILPVGFPTEYEYTWDDIRSFIKFDLVKGLFSVPFLDEREEKVYNKTIFSTKGKRDRIPTKGFFNLIDSDIKQRPLGLVELHIFGGKLTRKETEIRFENLSKEINRIEYFYYSFEKGKYVQVDIKNLNHQDTKKYLERERILKKSLSRLLRAEKDYLEKYDDFYFNLKSAQDGQKDDYKRYFKEYDRFLGEELGKGLDIKLAFSSITIPEYEFLREYTEQLRGEIKEGLKAITDYEEMKKANKKVPEVDLLKKSHQADSPEKALIDKLTKVKNKLIEFKTPRDETGINDLKGYAGYDLQSGLLFPNISEIERRTYFTDQPSNTVKEKDLIKEEISKLKKWD